MSRNLDKHFLKTVRLVCIGVSMKVLILVLISLIVASCGKYSERTDFPVPTELQTGTWISTDGSNVTTELVFTANDVTTTTSSPSVATETLTMETRPWGKGSFLVVKNNSLIAWYYRGIESNSVTICTPACKDFTR